MIHYATRCSTDCYARNRAHRLHGGVRLFVCLLVTLFSSCAVHREAGEITATVPDKAFRTLLLEKGYAERVFGHRLRPTAEGKALSELICYEEGIHSLRGIEMFPQLASLVCSGNPIEELDLNALRRLENLYGIHMPLRRLDIDSCRRLQHIELSYTHLDTFSLAPFPDLTYFFCIFSPLRELDLTPCPKMKSVYIRATQITDIDLTPCDNFFQLHATDTPLRTIHVTDEQMDSDIRVSCDDSVRVVSVPIPELSCIRTRAVLIPELYELGLTLDTSGALEHHYTTGVYLLGDSIPQQYMQAWQQFVLGLRNALIDAGMSWADVYRFWGRLFLAPDGSVDYYVYQWSGDHQPGDEWKAQFRTVVERYLATFRFAYTFNRRFSQCGSVVLRPAG